MNNDLEEFTRLMKSESEVEVAVPSDSIVKEQEQKQNVVSAKVWATSGNDYFPCETTTPQLAAGQYTIKDSPRGVYFSQRDINLDNLIVLPDSNSEQVLHHIAEFWKKEEVFRQYGFLWKRGIMLWGPPGSGKTSTVQQLSKQIVDLNGVTIYCTSPGLTAIGLELLRKIEPTRPIVVIFEDIDAIVRDYGESDVLAMLDGELQVDNVAFVATTNYPQRLDKRLINRPSRFDEIIKIDMPNAAARRCYLENKNPRLDDKELNDWVSSTSGFSIAHLKELIVSVECFGKPLEESVRRLRTMIDTKSSQYDYEQNTTSIGFVQD